MLECGSFHAEGNPIHDADLAESLVMQAYIQLPLLSRQLDGRWVAPLKRAASASYGSSSGPRWLLGSVLQFEVFDRRTQSILESRDCEEVEDAVTAFRAMLTQARHIEALLIDAIEQAM